MLKFECNEACNKFHTCDNLIIMRSIHNKTATGKQDQELFQRPLYSYVF